ncbi:class I SAM-dependent methyltransferase [Achromobacter xylosoxidans]
MNEQFELSARYYDAFYSQRPYRDDVDVAAGADCPALPAGGPRAGRGLRQPRARPALRSALSGRRAGQQRDLPGDRSAQDRRTPRPGAYHLHSMEDFSLDASYDAIVCLFSSIGYLPDADALRRTMHTFSDHLAPGGVIVVEPWLSAQQLGAFQSSQLVCADGLEIARIARHRVDGDKLTLWLHYLAGGPDDVRYFVEEHRMSLFSNEDYRDAFEHAGLECVFDPVGLSSRRGLYVCRQRDGA